MFSELFDIAPDAMIVVDREGNIVRANAQAVRLFGFSERELRNMTVEALIPEPARGVHRLHRADYAESPRTRPMGSGQELTGLKRDGSQFPIEIALSPIRAQEGDMFLASIRDISESQRARQALVRARYDTLLAQIGRQLLATQDLDAAVKFAPELLASTLGVEAAAIVFKHPQFRQMQVRAAFGVTPTTIAALPWPTILAESAAPGIAAGSDSSEAARGALVLTDDPALVTTGFGGAIVVPFFGFDEPLGALVALSDAPRNFDRDAIHLLQSAANLLAAAMQRIRTEEQLSHAQRLDAIGQLTGGIAHDFNNLLTVVSGNMQILRDRFADGSAEGCVIDTALSAVVRGGELTRKLLTFARQRHLAPRACDPKRVLDDLGAMLTRTLGETIHLDIGYPPDIPHVFADPGQLDGALVNLALNSRDAMPRGGNLGITVSRGRVSPADASHDIRPGSYVVFTVQDTGMGMPPEVLAHALEPFFTTKEQGKGSGLGLSTVYGFVKQSGGYLTIDSQLGYGTRIMMHLPRAEAPGMEAVEPTRHRAARGDETILVVEDEAHVRDIAIAFLDSMGYSVLSAADGETAIDLLATHPEVDLLFSDIVLGTGINGLELAEQARALRPGLPVLLTSGYESSAYENAGTTAGQPELLPKPYRREDLSAAVRRTLDHR